MSNFQVLFNGVTTNDTDAEGVERALAGELGIEHSKAKRLFNGRTVVLASQLSRDEALDLQRRLEAVGAISRIKDMTAKAVLPPDYEPERSAAESDLPDLTAAHVDCPRCGHMQLESSHCTRCGVDIEALFRKRRKEELLMEKKLRDHRAAQEKQSRLASESALADAAPESAETLDRKSGQLDKKGGLFARLFSRAS